MIWALCGLFAYGLLALVAGWCLNQWAASAWSVGLVGLNLGLGLLINGLMTRVGNRAAVAGDAARVLLRFVTLLMTGFLLEQHAGFPRRSPELWGWLLAGTLASLGIEIAVLLRITK